jgi:hypothetical protein
MALPVEGQVLRPPREGQFAAVERRAALGLGDEPRTGFTLDLGEDLRFLVAFD